MEKIKILILLILITNTKAFEMNYTGDYELCIYDNKGNETCLTKYDTIKLNENQSYHFVLQYEEKKYEKLEDYLDEFDFFGSIITLLLFFTFVTTIIYIFVK